MRKKRSYDSHATRERILDAAMSLFQARGYHATSMQDLLAAAAVPAGSMYHLFPTKKGLALAVIRERVAPAVDDTWVRRVRTARNVERAIFAVFSEVAASIDDRGTVVGCPVTNLAVELSGDPDLRAALQDSYAAWESAIRERLSETRPRAQAQRLATLIVATFAGAMSLAKAANGSAPLLECAKALRPLTARGRSPRAAE